MGNMQSKWEHRGMKMESSFEEQQTQPVSQKPVAYDVDGKPLYATPPEQQSASQPQRHQLVHVTRAFEPIEVELSPEARQKHEESKRKYPWLNLSEHEYVISDVRRHPIGLWGPIIITTLLVSLAFVLVADYAYVGELFGIAPQSYGAVALIGVLFAALVLIGGYLAIWVYTSNRFFMTNESVIQIIQNSIFSKKEQTASLMNIEDASYSQRGPLQVIFDYGSIRLSTEGDESMYEFTYVQDPKSQIGILNNAVEAFKNGRPVQLTPAEEEVS